jgi:hypothetical protein
MLQKDIDGVVAGKTRTPSSQVFTDDILKSGHGFLNDAKLGLRLQIAHELMMIAVAGDRVTAGFGRSRNLRIAFGRRSANKPAPFDIMFLEDFEQAPSAPPSSILTLAKIEGIGLPTRQRTRRFFRLMVHAYKQR